MNEEDGKMTTENDTTASDKEIRRRASTVSGGIFLISLGVLAFTGWWWPGIMFAIGLSSGAELIFRGMIWRGIGSLVFFSAIPIVIWIINETQIPWTIVGPLVLIGIGVIILVKAFVLRDE
jgi:hypothetical protein